MSNSKYLTPLEKALDSFTISFAVLHSQNYVVPNPCFAFLEDDWLLDRM